MKGITESCAEVNRDARHSKAIEKACAVPLIELLQCTAVASPRWALPAALHPRARHRRFRVLPNSLQVHAHVIQQRLVLGIRRPGRAATLAGRVVVPLLPSQESQARGGGDLLGVVRRLRQATCARRSAGRAVAVSRTVHDLSNRRCRRLW